MEGYPPVPFCFIQVVLTCFPKGGTNAGSAKKYHGNPKYIPYVVVKGRFRLLWKEGVDYLWISRVFTNAR